METKKYPKTYWNKLIIAGIIVIVGISIYLRINEINMTHSNVEDNNVGTITTSPVFISTNVQWKDSIYKIVLDESDLSWLINEDSKYKIVPPPQSSVWLSDKDTLIVDSLLNVGLKKFRITPQSYIDSIYCYGKGIQELVSTFVSNEYLLSYRKNGADLTLSEKRYLIYLLLKHNYTARIECESGYIMIYIEEENPILRWLEKEQ